MNKEILKNYKQKLKLAGYSFKTQKNYYSALKKVINYFSKSFDEVTEQEFKDYLEYLLDVEKVVESYYNQIVCAVKFYNNNKWNLSLIKPKAYRKLPKVISKPDVITIIESTNNLKHRAALTVMYSGALRPIEVVNLKVNDIDSSRNLIRVQKGKFSKDRYTILGKQTLGILRKYYLKYKPVSWLFPNKDDYSKHISVRTLERVFKKSLNKSKVNNRGYYLYCLRHSSATHMLESGIDISVISTILGHSTLKVTSEVYTHVSNKLLSKINSPLD